MNRLALMGFVALVAVLFGGPAARGGDTVDDEAFLNDLEQRGFRFFWEQADPRTGLIADRAPADGSVRSGRASIASTGFGLSAICIADNRGWIEREDAYRRVLTTLRFVGRELPHLHGFYYHFVDAETGERLGRCEVSSIDSSLLMAGVLTCRQHYADTEAARLATEIYQRVDWPWMMDAGETLSMGYKPESGFLAARWSGFSEHLFMYLMAIGSPTHPLPPEVWEAWRREPVITYAGRTYIQCPALFTHQYPHAWIDFRGKRDRHANYFRNSRDATLAQRQFCIDLHDRFPSWGENVWGLTACAGPRGYRGGHLMGGPPEPRGHPLDGLVAPSAPGGSIPFAPRECIDALRSMREQFGKRIYGRYGFCDSFNPETGWVAGDVIGIDVGITLLMAENYRTGLVWRCFMANPEIPRAMERVGFVADHEAD